MAFYSLPTEKLHTKNEVKRLKKYQQVTRANFIGP